MNKFLAFTFAIVIAVSQNSNAHSFEVDTHSALTERAGRLSNLDNFLKTTLLFSAGIEESISNGSATKSILEWIQEGSIREDDDIRFFNHFHNPLRAWDQAGLRIFGGQLGRSSILWAQNPVQGFAWQDARESYFNALTATTQSERERYFADTFQALGQLIHSVQDAAVPAHTRNDQHLRFEGFERYANNIQGTPLFNQLTVDPLRFDPSILNLPQNPLAPIPIARITDSTDPEQGAALPSAGTNQGMAEYTNANFLSGDTIFKNFTFPRLESIDLNFPLTENNRRYFTKIADGETNFFLVAEGTFTERLLSHAVGDKGFVLDPRVYQDYASRLFPRAIGYSAGLIDYFFRGRIELQNVQAISATSMRVKVKNATATEETGSGEVKAVLAFTREGQRSFAVSSSRGVNLTREAQDISFDFSQNPIPLDAVNRFFFVVYKGLLGLEEGAVVIGKCGIAETSGFITVDFPGAVGGTEIRGINNCGQIVGTAYFSFPEGSKGFIADTNGVIQQTVVYNGPLEPLGSSDLTEATDINNQGQVFGWYCCGRFGDRGFRREPDGSSVGVSPSGSMTSNIYGANDAGDVVGEYHPNPEGGIGGYVLYANGSSRDLGDRTPWDINNVGQIVGNYGTFGSRRGFLRNPDGSFISIDYPGASSTFALGINDSGQIVGCGSIHGFLRNPDGSFITIDYPGATWTCVSGINDSGQIVGYYADGAYNRHGFVGRIPGIE